MKMLPTVKIPRREREKLQRRQSIIAAAAQVFARDGYEKANLTTIAAYCELSKSTLYYYFPGKEALYASVLEEGFGRILCVIQGEKERRGNTRKSIQSILELMVVLMRNDSDLFRIVMREKMKLIIGGQTKFLKLIRRRLDKIIREITDIFELGISKGEIGDFNPELLAHLLFGLVHSYSLSQSGNISAKTLTDIFFDGVEASSG